MMSDDASSVHTAIAKRRRVNSENDLSELHQDPDLWLSDGNIVLTAKDSEGTTWGFRCHQSTLSKHSPVFESMFTMVQPEDAEIYEGLPLVALTDDCADLKSLLQILCDPFQYLPEPSYTTALQWQEDLRKISGPLKLSRKNEFAAIRRKLIAFLESRWPTTLEGWDRVARLIRETQETVAYYGETKDMSLEVNPVSTILLGEAAGVTSIFPATYYTLHTSWRMAYFSTTDDGREEFEEAYYPPKDLTDLSSQHLACFIEGSHCLRKAIWMLLSHHVPENLSDACLCGSAKEKCWKARRKWLDDKRREFGDECFLDPLWVLREMQDAANGLLLHPSDSDRQIGFHCRAGLVKALGACRQYLWDELPYFFRLEVREDDQNYGYDQYFHS